MVTEVNTALWPGAGFRVRLSGTASGFHDLLALCPWASFLFPLHLVSLIRLSRGLNELMPFQLGIYVWGRIPAAGAGPGIVNTERNPLAEWGPARHRANRVAGMQEHHFVEL